MLCSVDVTVIIFGRLLFPNFLSLDSPLAEKAGTHNEKLYEYCSTNDSDAQVTKRLDVCCFLAHLLYSSDRWCSGTEIGTLADPRILEAKNSSIPASSCQRQVRTRTMMTMEMAMETETVLMT